MRNKPRTLDQYIDYRNTLLIRRDARKRTFNDQKEDYYTIRIREIDEQYPQFVGIGRVTLKTPPRR